MSAWQRAIGIALVVTAAAIGAGCKNKSAGAAGKERAACYGNGTCDQGLQCLSAVCVRPPPADCAKVAEKLASYRLGNYARPDDRDRVVGELTGECVAARLSVDEGSCILEARTRLEVARCPRPLLAELTGDKDGCKGLGATITQIMLDELGLDGAQRQQAQALVPELDEIFTTSCVEDLWPEEAKRCVTSMRTSRDFGDCQHAFPKEIERAIERRILPVLDKLVSIRSGGGSTPEPPAPEPPPLDRAATSYEETCAGYIASMERFMTCEKIPQESRDAARAGLDQMRQSMAVEGLPAEAARAMQDACIQAQAAVDQSMGAMGCP